jgi:hypothetical protein
MSALTNPVPRSGFALPARLGMVRDGLIPLVAFGGAIFLPNTWITVAFVVVGQAHFAMTFLYQYRGKKMNTWYLCTAGVLALATLLYVLVWGELVVPIFLVVATLFSLHFALDEVTLHADTFTPRVISTVVGFVLLFVALMLSLVFPVYPFTLFPRVVAVLMVCGILVRLFSREPVARSEYYLWFVGSVLALMGIGLGLLQQVLAIVILLHCVNWMLGYGVRVQNDTKRARRYWLETLVTLLGSVLLYLLFTLAHVGILKYFFLLTYYDAWAIAHIVLSFRASKR